VAQQLDFPHDINWPQKPELLSGDDVLMQPK
jgi:hypothetical protein